MTARWRKRFATSGRVLLGAAILGLLIWMSLQDRVVTRRLTKHVSIVDILRPPPPPPPPHPPASKVQPAAPRPKAEPAPKSPQRPQEQSLALDATPTIDPFDIPQGTDGGFALGGGGTGGHGFKIGGGGGARSGECGKLSALSYVEQVNYEVMRLFRDDPAINRHEFIARVRLWFDLAGGVRQTEFESATGSASLDNLVAGLLRTIDMKETVPQCLQPITVRIVSPWDARTNDAGGGQENPKTERSQTLIWQRPPAR